jgi:hypothetical protein
MKGRRMRKEEARVKITKVVIIHIGFSKSFLL